MSIHEIRATQENIEALERLFPGHVGVNQDARGFVYSVSYTTDLPAVGRQEYRLGDSEFIDLRILDSLPPTPVRMPCVFSHA